MLIASQATSSGPYRNMHAIALEGRDTVKIKRAANSLATVVGRLLGRDVQRAAACPHVDSLMSWTRKWTEVNTVPNLKGLPDIIILLLFTGALYSLVPSPF